eukprot:TRINITY_DN65004_c0_g1_i1.p1 TRINITY_DN65004_c0_g1~~TRINITY_DN65004_c0_g1_i1.p1  ORF type:complete len:369 (+),score=52.01 TRINITY_DN65004_c0_g1_i1:180-1286(+)
MRSTQPTKPEKVVPWSPALEFIPVESEGVAKKWFFGTAVDKDGDVFCAPFSGHALAVIAGRRVAAVPGAGSSGCKWLGMAIADDRNIYCSPFNADSIMVIPPADPRKRAPFGSNPCVLDDRVVKFIKGVGPEMCKWTGAAKGNDGNIYCAPFNSESVLVIEPENMDFNLLQGAGSGKGKWSGAAVAPDGTIFCAPFNADSVLMIEPHERTLTFLGRVGSVEDETDTVTIPKGNSKWLGAAFASNGKIYCAPYNASTVLVINTKDKELSFIEGAGMGSAKWAGAAVGHDGRIYCAPYNASSVLIVDPETHKLTFLAGAGSEFGKWFGASLSVDGRVVCAPWNADSVLVITTKEEIRETAGPSLRRRMMS